MRITDDAFTTLCLTGTALCRAARSRRSLATLAAMTLSVCASEFHHCVGHMKCPERK
jgi:hypothetical protein